MNTDAAYPGDVERDFDSYTCIPGRDQPGDPPSERSAWLSADGAMDGKCQYAGDYQGGKETSSGTLAGRVDFKSGQVSFKGKSSQAWDFPKGHQAASSNAPAHYEKHFE